MVGHQKINLSPGQLVTGRKAIAAATGINESKVYRILDVLKSEQVIEQQTNSKFSVISITNWQEYQESEQQNEQQVNSKRTASEHKQEGFKLKNEEKEPKKTYGEFQNVRLTDAEHEKLKQKFNGSCQQKIDSLSEGIASKGYRYKDHYATILAWDRMEKKRADPRKAMIGAPITLECDNE